MSALEDLIEEYRENKALQDELAALQEDLKTAIIAAMNGKEDVYTRNAHVSYKPITQQRFDSAAFKAACPDTYAAYVKSSTYKRFCIK